MSLAEQPSADQAVGHFAIIDWEDGLGLLGRLQCPVVVELKPVGWVVRGLKRSERWALTEIPDASAARHRLAAVLRMPGRTNYHLVMNNCEHAARFVAFGDFRSDQVRR